MLAQILVALLVLACIAALVPRWAPMGGAIWTVVVTLVLVILLLGAAGPRG